MKPNEAGMKILGKVVSNFKVADAHLYSQLIFSTVGKGGKPTSTKDDRSTSGLSHHLLMETPTSAPPSPPRPRSWNARLSTAYLTAPLPSDGHLKLKMSPNQLLPESSSPQQTATPPSSCSVPQPCDPPSPHSFFHVPSTRKCCCLYF